MVPAVPSRRTLHPYGLRLFRRLGSLPAVTRSVRPSIRPWFLTAAIVWIALNVALLSLDVVRYFLVLPHDWAVFEELPGRIVNGTLYGDGWYWPFPPLGTWAMAYVIVPLGYSLWLGLHIALVPLLREWRLIALTLLSVPFWMDTIIGNTTVFFFVVGALAFRGSRWASVVFLAMCCLQPRPLIVPLVVWLLWKRPELRVPFAAMAGVTIVTAAASGQLMDWLGVMLFYAGGNNAHVINFGPTRLVGSAWLLVGLPLAAWLTWKGRVGLAGLAMSPYILPMYWIVILWELQTELPRPGKPEPVRPEPMIRLRQRPQRSRPRPVAQLHWPQAAGGPDAPYQ